MWLGLTVPSRLWRLDRFIEGILVSLFLSVGGGGGGGVSGRGGLGGSP